jgi:hypothetical protein
MHRSHSAGFAVKIPMHRGFEGIAVIRGLAPTLGLAMALAPAAALAQVNIDQDKSPAQIYAGDCAACHKSIRGLANGRGAGALAGFLTEHYTASAKEAAVVAAYVLASGGAVGRAVPARGQPEGDGSHAAAEPPKSREARRPEQPEEKPAAGAKPDVAGAGRKPEPERRAAAEPGRPGAAGGPLPDRRGSAASRTRGRTKPGEAAKPPEVATPAPASPGPEGQTAVVAAPPSAETPNPQANPAEGSQHAAAPPAQPADAAPPAQPAEGAPAPRDNIPD